MTDADVLVRLVVAAALGFAVGLERQLGRHPEEGYAGARTFTLIGLLGGLAALLASWYPGVGVAIVVLVLAILVTSYIVGTARFGDVGTTTELAGAVTFALGFLVHRGLFTVAIALTVIVIALLRSKPALYGLAERFSDDDVRAVLQFAVVTAVVLPFVPDQGFGPADAVNPHEIWLMVVLVGAIGLAGYVALRLLGPRGLIPTGLLGGFVSSTAVALAFGRYARSLPALVPSLGVGILAGSGLMYGRVWLEALIVAPDLAARLVVPMAVLFVLVEGAAVVAFVRSGPRRPVPAEGEAGRVAGIRNPTSLATALQFGLFYGVVVAVARLLVERVSTSSLVILAAVTGITDVDAITLTAANLVREGVDPDAAVSAVIAAVAVNSGVKAAIVWVVGGSEIGRRVTPTLGTAMVLAAAALLF